MLELESEVVGKQLRFGGNGGSVLSVVVAVAGLGRMLVVGVQGEGHREGGCHHPLVDHQGQPLREEIKEDMIVG